MKLKQINTLNFSGLIKELSNSEKLKRKVKSILSENIRLDAIYIIRSHHSFHLLGFESSKNTELELFTTDREQFIDPLYYVNTATEGSDLIHYKDIHTRVTNLNFVVLLNSSDLREILNSLNLNLSQNIETFRLANHAIYRNLNEIKSILSI